MHFFFVLPNLRYLCQISVLSDLWVWITINFLAQKFIWYSSICEVCSGECCQFSVLCHCSFLHMCGLEQNVIPNVQSYYILCSMHDTQKINLSFIIHFPFQPQLSFSPLLLLPLTSPSSSPSTPPKRQDLLWGINKAWHNKSMQDQAPLPNCIKAGE